MLWILSLLRAFHGFVRAHLCRAFLPLLLFFAAALSGVACRDDEGDALRGEDSKLDDSEASPIAGALQGVFSVSSTGEATYALPLILPPGAAGIQPSLGVAYSSAAGEGMLGVGFSLSGLSAITRCPRSMAQDGEIRSVRGDQKDSLCLDGARLVPVGSSNGVVQYRTFPETFVKVLAYPSTVVGRLRIGARSLRAAWSSQARSSSRRSRCLVRKVRSCANTGSPTSKASGRGEPYSGT